MRAAAEEDVHEAQVRVARDTIKSCDGKLRAIHGGSTGDLL